MNKIKYIFVVAVAVLSLTAWSSRSFEEGAVVGGGAMNASDTFEASNLIGYRLYSPDYFGENL